MVVRDTKDEDIPLIKKLNLKTRWRDAPRSQKRELDRHEFGARASLRQCPDKPKKTVEERIESDMTNILQIQRSQQPTMTATFTHAHSPLVGCFKL